ncbi:unnamed protein product [Leuciscus chuanchicus]
MKISGEHWTRVTFDDVDVLVTPYHGLPLFDFTSHNSSRALFRFAVIAVRCSLTQRLRHGLCLGSVQRCSTLFTRALISQALRSFSDAPSTTKDLNKPIKQWELLVSPFTKSLPIPPDLHIKTKDQGNVKIQNMESDLCHVLTERGHCVLKSVKGHEVQVKSTGGNVTGLKTLHGNVDIRTSGDSNINIKKIQGTTMNLSTEHGDLKAKAIYGESTSMSTSSGNIQIGHVHGEALVRSETGNIMIDSSSGVLKVFTAAGNIDAYVGQDGSAELHSQQGAVSVRVPSIMKTAVQLCGTSVSISSEIECQETERTSANGKTTVTAHLNGGTDEERWIKATAEKGAVKLRSQSWFETLRLGAQS